MAGAFVHRRSISNQYLLVQPRSSSRISDLAPGFGVRAAKVQSVSKRGSLPMALSVTYFAGDPIHHSNRRSLDDFVAEVLIAAGVLINRPVGHAGWDTVRVPKA